MKQFDFAENRDEILKRVNLRLKQLNLTDPDGFTLLEGFVAPIIHSQVEDVMDLRGRLLPQVAVIGKKTGVVHYFYLDNLFPGQGLD